MLLGKDGLLEQLTLENLNSYHDKIRSVPARFLYTFLVQMPVNILAKLTEVITTPPVIFVEHIFKNQKLGSHATRDKLSILSMVKNRLSLFLKLPFDLVTAAIKMALFLPYFIIHAPLELISAALCFVYSYIGNVEKDVVVFGVTKKQVVVQERSNGNKFIEILAALSIGVLLLPYIALIIANDIVHQGFMNKLLPGRSPNISIASALELFEAGINKVASIITFVIVEVVLFPITGLIYLINKFIERPHTEKYDNHSNTDNMQSETIEVYDPSHTISVPPMLLSGGPNDEQSPKPPGALANNYQPKNRIDNV